MLKQLLQLTTPEKEFLTNDYKIKRKTIGSTGIPLFQYVIKNILLLKTEMIKCYLKKRKVHS